MSTSERSGEDDVAFRLLHTADWHLGKQFPAFEETAQVKLRQARLAVLHEVFATATRSQVDAVLCAGDLFDVPNPHADWWRGLLNILARLPRAFPPVFLLPGNHDPCMADSVWAAGHEFRASLPPFVHVVDREDFEHEIKPGLVLHAVPCFSKAGAADPVEKIPARAAGDDRVRVGMVHGSTLGMDKWEANFPIRAGSAAARGLDYLAIGDTHGYRVIQEHPPVIYPGAPEPTAFDEVDAGHVVVICFSRSRGRPLLRKVPVARWRWRAETIRDLATLRDLVSQDLRTTVLRLDFDLAVDLGEREEIDRLLQELAGDQARPARAGIMDADLAGLSLRVDTADHAFPSPLPPTLETAIAKLRDLTAHDDPATARRARLALYKLSTLTQPRSPR